MSTAVASTVLIPRRGEIWWVALDPTRGSEVRKTRPCVVISTDALRALPLRTVVPLTEWQARHAQRWSCVRIEPEARNGLGKPSAADGTQVRCVALERFERKLGDLEHGRLREVVAAVGITIEAV